MEQKKITAADIIRKFREMDTPRRQIEPGSAIQAYDRRSELAARIYCKPRRAVAK